MTGDELNRKHQHALDGIALASDAHEAGVLEGLVQAYKSAKAAESLDDLAEDLRLRIAEITARREEPG